jgi:hypothetical protein
MTAKLPHEIAAELRATIAKRIARLEAETRRDYIVAWDYGLAVGYRDGKMAPVSLEEADGDDGSHPLPNVFNGKNEPARFISRSAAIAAYLPKLREMLAGLNA